MFAITSVNTAAYRVPYRRGVGGVRRGDVGSNRRRQACFREPGLLTCVGDAVLFGTSGSRPRTFKQSRSETARLAQAMGGRVGGGGVF